MESLIQLNLRSDSEKAAADNLSNAQYQRARFPAMSSKRLNRMLKKAAHKATGEFGQSGKGGIFSK